MADLRDSRQPGGPLSTQWRDSQFASAGGGGRQPSQSLARQLSWVSVMALGLALTISGMALAFVAYVNLRDEQVRSAKESALLLADNVAATMAFQDVAAASQALRSFNGRNDLRALELLLPDGRSFASWVNVGRSKPTWTSKPPIEEVGPRGLTLSVPVRLQGDNLGTLVWSEDFGSLRATLLRLVVSGALILVITLLASVFALQLLQRRALAPLFALNTLVDHVARTQDYSLRAPIARRDEVGRLTERVNALLRRIEIWHADISDQLQQEQRSGDQLKQLAHRDVLTGLPNRLAFELALERLVLDAHHQGHRLALLFIDLDNFKQVNDTLGHAAGDEVLVEVSRRMSDALRTADTLFRLGGDEFALLVRQVNDPIAVEALAERLIAGVRARMSVRGTVVPVGATVGVAFCPDDAGDAQALLQAADEAMYAAKRAGKNTFKTARGLL